MKITEYCDAINADIVLRYYQNQGCRWMAKIENADTKESRSSSVICGSHGNGNTPEAAIADYVEQIMGRVLVLNSLSDDRREFYVPETIEGI